MDDILLLSGEIVIQANDLISFIEESFTKMRAYKTGTTGD
jgi:hypothetical protein